MPKQPKKLSTTSQRKRRPKGVYAKGWATRRLRKVAREAYLEEAGSMVKAIASQLPKPPADWNPTTVAEAALMGAGAAPSEGASRGDAVISLLAIHRDEQLACFMADMQCMRRMGMPSHAPIMVSRSQIEAIEDLLGELGYSMFGRRTSAQGGETAITKD